MNTYSNQPEILTEWSDSVFKAMIDRIIVYDDRAMKFIFKSGYEVKI